MWVVWFGGVVLLAVLAAIGVSLAVLIPFAVAVCFSGFLAGMGPL